MRSNRIVAVALSSTWRYGIHQTTGQNPAGGPIIRLGVRLGNESDCLVQCVPFADIGNGRHGLGGLLH